MGDTEQPLAKEMSWPDLIKTLVWLATSEDVPAMEQIQAATLVLDAAEASDEEWPDLQQKILRLLGSRAVN